MKFVACVNKIACMTARFYIFSKKKIKCFIDFFLKECFIEFLSIQKIFFVGASIKQSPRSLYICEIHQFL